MVTLSKLLPKSSEFEVVFLNGKKRTLKLRPYTLRDEAYLQENFEGVELAEKLQSMNVDLISKLLWRQLEPESRALFDEVIATDDDGKQIELEGYQKFQESLGGLDQVMNAFNALMECRGINSVVNEIMGESSKKKKKKPLISRLFSTN